MTPLAPGSCEHVPLPSARHTLLCWLISAVPVALLLHLGLSALPVQSSGSGVYCSVRNLIYSCQMRLHHSIFRKVWLFKVHEILEDLGLIRFFHSYSQQSNVVPDNI